MLRKSWLLVVFCLAFFVLAIPCANAFNEFDAWEQKATPEPSKTPPPARKKDSTSSESQPDKVDNKQEKENPSDNEKNSEEESDQTKDEEDNRMGWFTLTPRIGYSWIQKTHSIENFEVPARNVFKLTVGFDFGGDEFGFQLHPFFSYQRGKDKPYTSSSNSIDPSNPNYPAVSNSDDLTENSQTSSTNYKLKAYGVYFGTMYHFRKGNFYPGIGLGTQIAYLTDPNIEYGLDMFLRLPFELSWYVTEDFALVAEFAFLYGVTGWKGKNKLFASNFATDSLADGADLNDFGVGHGMAIDMMVGLRFP